MQHARATAGAPSSSLRSMTHLCASSRRPRRRSGLVRAEGRGGGALTTETKTTTDVLIVGGGVAGLACAVELHKQAVPFVLVEAQDEVGGRVRTDQVDGFTLDRGFQIFLTAYPKARELLDYDRLRLHKFYAGASVRHRGEFHKVADPFRHPLDGILSLANPVGSVADKVLIGVYRFQAFLKSTEEIFRAEETSIAERLRQVGFSESVIKSFFRPFLGGIFFDRDLGTTSRLLEFVMKMLATGSNCLPANGIGSVPKQLAEKLPEASLRLNSRVKGLEIASSSSSGSSSSSSKVRATTSEGVVFEAKRLVIATEEFNMRKLLAAAAADNDDDDDGGDVTSNADVPLPPVGTTCLYFWTSEPAPNDEEPILYLNGDDDGLVNNCCFPSTVCPSYAPPGKTLVSVSLVGVESQNDDDWGDDILAEEVKREMEAWFGRNFVQTWTFLKCYRIPYAQPNQTPNQNNGNGKEKRGTRRISEDVFCCGDYLESATLEGALVSGTKCGKEVSSEIR